MSLRRSPIQSRQGDPGSAGSYTYDQLKNLWVTYGGNPQAADMAAAIAMAESGGKADATNINTDGSTDRGLWQINSVHGSQSTHDVRGNTIAAINISNDGKDWSPWSTFKNGAFQKFLKGGSSPVTGGDGTGGGGSSGNSSSVGSVLDLLTAPIDTIGGWLAGIALNLVKDVAIGIADIIIIPAWHWNQRAVYQYQKDMFEDKTAKQLLWTGVFWGGGYWLLFTDPSSGHVKPAAVRNSRLARHTRLVQSVPARQSLIKPKDVKAKTPTKPKPIPSRASVTQTGTMSTTRNQTVKVTGTHARFDNGNGTESAIPLRREGESESPRSNATGDGGAEPRPEHRAGTRSLPTSRRNPQGGSGTGRNGGGNP